MKKLLLTTVLLTMFLLTSNAQELFRKGSLIRQTVTFNKPVVFDNEIRLTQFITPGLSRTLRIDSNGVVFPDTTRSIGGGCCTGGTPYQVLYYDSAGNVTSEELFGRYPSYTWVQYQNPNDTNIINGLRIGNEDYTFSYSNSFSGIAGSVDNKIMSVNVTKSSLPGIANAISIDTISARLSANNYYLIIDSAVSISNSLDNLKRYNFPTDTPSVGQTLTAIANDGNGTAQLGWVNYNPYKVYTALLSQTGTNAPTAIVLENNLGTINYEYEDVGTYNVTSSNLFTNNKTFITLLNAPNGDPSELVGIIRVSASELQIVFKNGGTPANSRMFNVPLEIRVYE